jgi:NhaP-type Na+/H+ or K+/H+ antiporter
MYFGLACFAALLFVYSLISEKVERLSLSGPIVFVTVGVALGPLGLEWFNPSVNFGNGKLLMAHSRQNAAFGFARNDGAGRHTGHDVIPRVFRI